MKSQIKHKDRTYIAKCTVVLLIFALLCVFITAFGAENGLKASIIALTFAYLILEATIFGETAMRKRK